jgi:hypothetical protein
MVTKRRRRESGIFVPAPFVLINMGVSKIARDPELIVMIPQEEVTQPLAKAILNLSVL